MRSEGRETTVSPAHLPPDSTRVNEPFALMAAAAASLTSLASPLAAFLGVA
jgi:hypothetical protein